MNRYLLQLSIPLLALTLAACGDSVSDGPVDDAGASADATDSQGEAGADTGDASEETEPGPDLDPIAPPTRSRVGKRMTVEQLRATIPIVAGRDEDGDIITWRVNAGTNPTGTEMLSDNQLGPLLGDPDYIERVEEPAIPNALYVKLMDDMARQVCTNMAEADRKRADTDARVLTREIPIDSVDVALIEQNLRYLHLRFYGERAAADDEPTIDALRELFFVAHDEAVDEGDPVGKTAILEGWRVVCIAMLKSPEFHLY